MRADFQTPVGKAFVELGARDPRREWSMFDVLKSDAEKYGAKILVTTIWNVHGDGSIAIHKNTDGTYWYWTENPKLKNGSKKLKAHWERLNFAFDRNVPVLGVLRDHAEARHYCAVEFIFKCIDRRLEKSGHRMWFQIVPMHEVVGVGCEVIDFDLAAELSGRRLSDGKDIFICGEPEKILDDSLEMLGNVSDLMSDYDHILNKKCAKFVSTKARLYQSKFRQIVFLACKGRCVISGCDIPEAVEAAHLSGRSWEAGHNSADDGILLRRDLHALYDSGLIKIVDDVVYVDDGIRNFYGKYHKIKCLNK